MALKKKSLFLYGYEVTALNRSLDFKVNAGPTRQATLRTGYYSLTSLLTEVVRALQSQEPLQTFAYSVNRSIAGNLENRVTLTIAAGTLTLLFGTGPRVTSSIGPTLGFAVADVTGASLTGTSTTGTALQTELVGYNYLGPDFSRKVKGSVNISASGVKEAIVYEVQQFTQVEFKHEPEAKVMTEWRPMLEWMIKQRPFEFTPEFTSPNDIIEGTLERTQYDSNGLGYQMTEMLPDFPFYYRTGLMVFRKSTGPYAILTP